MGLRVKGIDPRRVRRAREEAGLNQEELAARIGCSARSIQNWEAEADGRRPRSQHLRALAQATGKPVVYFFGEEEEVAA